MAILLTVGAVTAGFIAALVFFLLYRMRNKRAIRRGEYCSPFDLSCREGGKSLVCQEQQLYIFFATQKATFQYGHVRDCLNLELLCRSISRLLELSIIHFRFVKLTLNAHKIFKSHYSNCCLPKTENYIL